MVIIGGNFGNCLDASAKIPGLISDVPCNFKSGEQFLYSASGQIESTSGKKCLQPLQATQNAAIEIVKCDPNVRLQIWQLGH